MHLVLEVLRILGAVGVMAVPAVHIGGSDVDVGLTKGLPFEAMASATEGMDGLNDKGRFRREVRFVASLTVASSR
jgi:hypothetical protein